MKVHVVKYRYTLAEMDGFDVIGVYFDYDKACLEMARHMKQVYDRNVEYYGDRFDSDFEVTEENYISFGFYGEGYECDQVWVAEVDTMEVE